MGQQQSTPSTPPIPFPPPPPPPPTGPAPVHAPRGRLLTDSDGSRTPYDRNEVRRFFATASHRDAVFSHPSLEEAANLSAAFNLRGEDSRALRPHDHIMCADVSCEDVDTTFPGRGPLTDFVLAPPPFELPGAVSVPCTRQALWTNTASTVPRYYLGVREISMCLEAPDNPAPPPGGPPHHPQPRGLVVCYNLQGRPVTRRRLAAGCHTVWRLCCVSHVGGY